MVFLVLGIIAFVAEIINFAILFKKIGNFDGTNPVTGFVLHILFGGLTALFGLLFVVGIIIRLVPKD